MESSLVSLQPAIVQVIRFYRGHIKVSRQIPEPHIFIRVLYTLCFTSGEACPFRGLVRLSAPHQAVEVGQVLVAAGSPRS